MGIKDIERIMKRLPHEEIDDPVKLPLFLEILTKISEAMLSRILGLFGFDDDLATTLWAWVNSFYNKLLLKMFPYDPYFAQWEEAYRQRYERALRAYLNGHPELWERLIEDILGGD